MAVRSWTSKTIGVQRDTFEYACVALANSDTTIPLEIGQFADKTVHICNDFGTSGSSTFYGSNRDADVTRDGQGVITGHATEPDATGATNGWVPLKDPQGNNMTYTAKDGEVISQNFKYLMAKVTAGTSVNLQAYVYAKRSF